MDAFDPRMKPLILLLRLFASMSAALFAAGCAGVYAPKPVGEKPHALAKSDWEGTWIGDHDGVARVSVTDAANGWIKIVSIPDKVFEQSEPKLEFVSVQITESGGWLFANVHDEDAKRERYSWGRIKLEGDQVIVWVPDLEKFRALVRDGKLKGRLEGDDVALEPLTPADLKALSSGALGLPLAWDKPYVFRRVAH
jgi:hypothetical protein